MLAELCPRFQVRELSLFGSAARGEARPCGPGVDPFTAIVDPVGNGFVAVRSCPHALHPRIAGGFLIVENNDPHLAAMKVLPADQIGPIALDDFWHERPLLAFYA